MYLRISLDKDGDERAVTRQRQDAQHLAKVRGWEIVDEYVDNSISASKAEVIRPEYERMLADYQRGRFDAIICYDLDRLTRQPRQLEDWIDHAERHGLMLVTLNGEADLTTDGGRMYARIKAAVARAEVERKSVRHKRANRQRAEQGHWQFSRRPYAYERVDGEVKIVEKEAKIVREGYRRYIAGESYYSIAADWNARDDVPRWVQPKKKDGREAKPGAEEWSMHRVRQLLRNPRYAGIVVHNGEVFEIEPDKRQWTPLIDERTWNDYLAIRDSRKRPGSWSTSTKHLLSGMTICGVCGERLLARPEYRLSREGQRVTQQSYQCQKSWCVAIRAEQLEQFAEALVFRRLADKNIVRALRKTPDTEPLRKELADVRARRDRIVDLLSEGLLDKRKAREQATALTSRLEELNGRLSVMRRQSPLTDLAASRGVELKWARLDVLERRRVIEELGLRITIRKAGKGRRPLGPDGKPLFDEKRVVVEWIGTDN